MPKFKPFRKSLLLFVGLLSIFMGVCSVVSEHHSKVWGTTAPYVYELLGVAGAGGTGFQLLTKDGPIIVTNSHVCELAPTSGKNKGLMIAKQNGHWMKRKVLKVDTQADLCLVEAWPVSAGLKLADEAVEEGDTVIAIGHPLLGPLKEVRGKMVDQEDIVVYHHLMTTHKKDVDKFLKVTGEKCNLPKNKVMEYAPQFWNMFTTEKVPVCMNQEKNAIATDLEALPGNSGSPLLNKSGEVVGVVFATDMQTHHGYAVNLYHLKRLLKSYKIHTK